MTNKELIHKLALFLYEYDLKMSVRELADLLNRNGYRTSYGAEYQGERGTLKLISSTYQWVLDETDDQNQADAVASSFVKENGAYAYEK